MAAPSTPLSRGLIARTALAMTRTAGMRQLSMRKLGTELGVEAMSLYHYVSSKDDLLDAMLDCLFSELDLPVHIPMEDWESWTRESLRAYRNVLVAHAGAFELFASRTTKSEDSYSTLLLSYQRLQLAGIEPEEANKVIHFGVSFVLGHVGYELGALAGLDERAQEERSSISDPYAAEVVGKTQHLTDDDRFEAGLDMIVAAIRSKLPPSMPGAA